MISMVDVRKSFPASIAVENRANFKGCERFLEINIFIAERNIFTTEARVLFKKDTAAEREFNVWSNKWPSTQENLKRKRREDIELNTQEEIITGNEDQDMREKEKNERRRYQLEKRKMSTTIKNIEQNRKGRYREERKETRNYYHKFNNRETEIEKKNWDLGFQKERHRLSKENYGFNLSEKKKKFRKRTTRRNL